MALAQKIANSYYRACGQKGHWKTECAKKNSQSQGGSPSPAASVPISLAVVDEVPMEIAHIPELSRQVTLPAMSCESFGVSYGISKGDKTGVINGSRDSIIKRVQHALRHKMQRLTEKPYADALNLSQPAVAVSHNPRNRFPSGDDVKVCDTHFASSRNTGVVDLGASQTVIGIVTRSKICCKVCRLMYKRRYVGPLANSPLGLATIRRLKTSTRCCFHFGNNGFE